MKVDELRSTLQEYAAGVAHDAPHPRVVAVRGRVQAVRRRRRAAGVAGLAAAVVLAAAVAVVPGLGTDGVAPTGRPAELAGRGVPHAQTALGYTYHYARGLQSAAGAHTLRLDLGRSNRPRLVMWATSDTADQRSVRVAGGSGAGPDRTAPGDFDRYRYLDPGVSADVVVRRANVPPDSRLALAVYDLQKEAPRGSVSDGTSTFRRTVMDTTLLAARFGAPGTSAARVPFTVPAVGDLGFREVCRGATGWVELSVAGHDLGGSSCGDTDGFDSQRSGFTVTAKELQHWGLAAGERVVAQLSHSRGSGTARPTAPQGLVVGLGVYDDRTRYHRVARMLVPDASEDYGHEWIASRWVLSAPGDKALTVTVHAGRQPRLVRAVAGSGQRHPFRWETGVLQPDGGLAGVVGFAADQGGASSSTIGVVQPGRTVTYAVVAQRGLVPTARLGIVVSDQVH